MKMIWLLHLEGIFSFQRWGDISISIIFHWVVFYYFIWVLRYISYETVWHPSNPWKRQLWQGNRKSWYRVRTQILKRSHENIQISKICQLAELREPVGNDLIIKFDFTTQEGREKEGIEYFESGLDYDNKDSYDYDLSPLQNWFGRPKKSGKLDLYESTNGDGKGRVTLEYRIYKEQIDEEGEDISKIFNKFSESTFHPDLKVTADFYGEVETSKKNRIKLKLDYIDFHASS